MRAPSLLSSFLALPLLACGGDSKSADTDAGPDNALQCVEPTEGMQVDKDTLLCAGSYQLSAFAGKAAIEITASDVRLSCEEGTIIESAVGVGSTDQPLVGIGIKGQSNIAIQGCTVKGFRYGISAFEVESLNITDAKLDDNFTDPMADWVQDSVQGGGIRLEEVEGAEIKDSSFARNWNGLELRSSRSITVTNNVADHCSNTGVTLVDSHDSVFENNDFSWAIRGEGLSYPGKWYGIDTKDSAGVIVDAGSSGNRFINNDFTYGGDGIFVRSVIGGCAPDNWFEGNDTSFSPHNAIECWCDRNAFVNNIASQSHYGIWLGGTDEGIVRGNTVDFNRVDGISIQIAEDRHTIIEGNTVTNSGRVGLLLTGREYQAWHSLSHWADRLANSSHLIVQNNDFGSNHETDIFISSTRSVVLASNCGDGGEEPSVRLENESEQIVTASACGDGTGRVAPTFELVGPTTSAPGGSITVEASDVMSMNPGDASFNYTWLVQPSGPKFPALALPPRIADSVDGDAAELTFANPGVYDVDLTVDDGHLASMDHLQVFVEPEGMKIGAAASDWTYECTGASCTTSVDDGDQGVHISTNAPYEFAAITPATGTLDIDTSGIEHIGFFIRGWNNNGLGWQGAWPAVVVKGAAGESLYEPGEGVLTTDGKEWVYVDVPLSGNASWKRTGPYPTTIDSIEIHSDTYGWEAVAMWIDALTLY
jgi:parallel beta-helix repeat protein